MAGKKNRKQKRVAQLARRKRASKERKLVADLDKAFALGPGGSPERPLTIATPALLKGGAEALACPRCQGPLRLTHDEVDRSRDALLRVANCKCVTCGATRKVWFRIQVPVVN